jgi:diacylglycerol kinase family enzyme
VAAVRARFRVEVRSTAARDSGIELAQEAAAEGAPLVIAFGGDGHINEVANGLAGSATALGIVPGGTMNVFARALGLPLNPIEAVDRLRALCEEPPRSVPLGRMDGRYFTFAAGCGFDAEAAGRVERYVPAKRRFGELFFYWSAFRVLAGSYRHRKPYMTIKGNFGEERAAMAIVCNAGPYAYLARRPVNITPGVHLDGGLHLFALRSMKIEELPFYAWRVMASQDIARHSQAIHEPDLDEIVIASERPFARHTDGEPLPSATEARFTLVKDALRVLAAGAGPSAASGTPSR